MELVAIGRSSLLFDSIKLLAQEGHSFSLIVTEAENPEHSVSLSDFEKLAITLNADFVCTKRISEINWEKYCGITGLFGITVNWRFIIPEEILLKFDWLINLHIGNLPDYKGNATLNWAILNGENFIYSNIHKVQKELDAGDIIAKQKIDITSNTKVGDILDASIKGAPKLFLDAVCKLEKDPTYYLEKNGVEGYRCFPRNREDGRINWDDSALNIDRLIRASSKPYPGAFCYYQGEEIKVFSSEVVNQNLKVYAQPGQIIEKTAKELIVKTGEGAVKLWSFEDCNGRGITVDFVKGIRNRLT